MPTDHRSAARRRGAALEKAILAAAVRELTEVGFARMSVESVARRAGAGKVSVYRRWPSKAELAVAAAYFVMAEDASTVETGTLRGDLIAWLRAAADLLAGPAGEAFRGVISESLANPSDATLASLQRGSGARRLKEVLHQAALRGDDVVIDPPVRQLQAPQALLQIHFLTHHGPIDDAVIENIVDEVALPLLTHRPTATPHGNARTTGPSPRSRPAPAATDRQDRTHDGGPADAAPC